MNDMQDEVLEHEEAPIVSAGPSSRAVVLGVGGLFLLGLALSLLLFGDSLFPQFGETSAVDLPQIPAPGGAAAVSDLQVGPLVAGDRAYDFSLQDMDGQQVALSDYAGRPLIINFWATWCAPCRLEMPELQQAYNAHQDKGLAVLAINQQEQPRQVSNFFDELGLTFTPLLDSDAQVSRAYGALGLPSSYFVNADGEVTAVHRGILTESQIETYLAQTLP